jgi:hypothetical protein
LITCVIEHHSQSCFLKLNRFLPVKNLDKNLTVPPQTKMGKAFELAGLQSLARKPALTAEKYPELVQ